MIVFIRWVKHIERLSFLFSEKIERVRKEKKIKLNKMKSKRRNKEKKKV